MNMISSTSTTSTSGVMLISDCRLDPESLLLNCMMSLSFCASALCDQADSAKTGLLDRNHDLTNLAEIQLCIAPDHNLGARLGAYRSAERLVEMLGCDSLIVDPQPARLVDGHQDSASLVALRARFGRVRQVDVGPLPHLGHHHHVDERRDVDCRLHSGRLTESHRLDLPL